MKHLLLQSRFKYLIQRRNEYLFFAAGSLLLNLLLMAAMFLLIGHERIVIVPPVVGKSFWVTGNQVSPEYLADMSLFFINLRLNVTANNAATMREQLLRHVAPDNYNDIKLALLTEGEALKKNHITMAFFPIDVVVDAKKLIAKVTGDLQSTVGSSHLPGERVTYQIQYRYLQGRLYVTRFEEVKSHA